MTNAEAEALWAEAMLWHLAQIRDGAEQYKAALAKARYHVVSHVAFGHRFGREESVVVGRIILTGDETMSEIAERLASHGFDPKSHRISLDGRTAAS